MQNVSATKQYNLALASAAEKVTTGKATVVTRMLTA